MAKCKKRKKFFCCDKCLSGALTLFECDFNRKIPYLANTKHGEPEKCKPFNVYNTSNCETSVLAVNHESLMLR